MRRTERLSWIYMTETAIDTSAAAWTEEQIALDPAKIEFGKTFCSNWFVSEYSGNRWRNARVEPLQNIQLHPAAVVLHYGQAIFEGLKAYRWADGRIALFRPRENGKRFVSSAQRMAMPPVEPEFFVEALKAIASVEKNSVPREPGTLYLRPTMVATEPCIGVRAANEFLFYIIAMPAGAYFKGVGVGAGSVPVYVAETTSRASRGGTGNVKAAANYAISLKTTSEAKQAGCPQVLFLSACGERLIEEMGGMNVFFRRERTLLTPPLDGTILPGITRDSIIHLAHEMGLDVLEQPLRMDDIAAEIERGEIREGFACGTAATITGIKELVFETGRRLTLQGGAGGVIPPLYERLQGIQFGRVKDKHGWIEFVA